MSKRKFLFFFLLIFSSLKCFPAVFVVTSNADSGPGTLRDALTKAAANGTAEKDYINFNMADPSETGRTITVFSSLPRVTSNLVIDGTTQPGPALGVSNAKIIIQAVEPGNGDSGYDVLILYNVTGFELYGLYMRDIDAIMVYPIASTSGYIDITSAIYIEASQDITIGAPGKGNVFANVGHAIEGAQISVANPGQPPAFGFENLKFQSNICGFEPDGTTFRPTNGSLAGGFVCLNYCKGDILIGGDDVADRNIFANYFSYINQPEGFSILFPANITIKNNYFDQDVNGKPVPFRNSTNGLGTIMYLADDRGGFVPNYTISILNNKMQYPGTIIINHIQGEIDFKGNSIVNGQAVNKSPGPPQFVFQSDSPVLIGGEQPGDANSIYGTQLSIFSKSSVLIQRNSIYCVDNNAVWVPDVQLLNLIPKIAITGVSPTSVSGTATPLSKIELFYDDDCVLCQPLTYFATLTADASGNWSYSGPLAKGVIASATLNGYTSLFTTSATATYTLTQSSCGINGSLTNFAFSNSGGYQVKNAQGQIINNATLSSLAAGQYTLTAENGTCSTDYPFTIFDATPQFNDSKMVAAPPACGSLGSITGITLNNTGVLALDPNAYKFNWLDANNNSLGNSLDIDDLPAGSYTLQATYIKDNCSKTYGPIILKNASGPAIDQSAITIVPASCGMPNGVIKGIQTTGTVGAIKYTWLNGQQQTVGTDKDLTGQPPGTYRLEITDGSKCGPVYSADITITESYGINMDLTGATIGPATCGLSNGSVKGIVVSGATSYQWVDASGKVITTYTPELTNAPAGTYALIILNPACNISGGNYTIPVASPLTIVEGSGTQTDDQCNSHSAGIKNITIKDGIPPYTYSWTDAAGNIISKTADLINAGAGTYTLTVADGTPCPATAIYTLQNHDVDISPPAVNNVQLCGPGTALMQVSDPLANYSYRLYNSATGPTPIDEQKSGIFKITANANSAFYVSRFFGDCESTRTRVNITIGLTGVNIDNAFTPNGDGINDYWQIKNIDNYPGALIQVFNRNGQKVFESKGYGVPFDGTYDGKELPAGVYYYVINLGIKCNLLSGSLTIIR